MLPESAVDLYEDTDFAHALNTLKEKMLPKFRYVFKESLTRELVQVLSLSDTRGRTVKYKLPGSCLPGCHGC